MPGFLLPAGKSFLLIISELRFFLPSLVFRITEIPIFVYQIQTLNISTMKTTTNYFSDCKTLDEAKSLYFDLAKKLHPDMGGSSESFQNLNSQFHSFKPSTEKFSGEFEKWMPENYIKIVESLMRISGITITICGSWIWLGGETKAVKEEIKAIPAFELGFNRGFSKDKSMWYFSPVGYRKKSKRELSFDEIQNWYGSEEIKSRSTVKEKLLS